MARPGMASVRMEIKCREILELNPSMRVAKAAKKMVTFMTGPDDEDVSADHFHTTWLYAYMRCDCVDVFSGVY